MGGSGSGWDVAFPAGLGGSSPDPQAELLPLPSLTSLSVQGPQILQASDVSSAARARREFSLLVRLQILGVLPVVTSDGSDAGNAFGKSPPPVGSQGAGPPSPARHADLGGDLLCSGSASHAPPALCGVNREGRARLPSSVLRGPYTEVLHVGDRCVCGHLMGPEQVTDTETQVAGAAGPSPSPAEAQGTVGRALVNWHSPRTWGEGVSGTPEDRDTSCVAGACGGQREWSWKPARVPGGRPPSLVDSVCASSPTP